MPTFPQHRLTRQKRKAEEKSDEQYVTIISLYTNEFFHLVRYNKLGIVHCMYLGVSGYSFKEYCIFLSEVHFYFNNSVDPDEMPHCAVFHLGLHCL